jgi:hypothetical protein
VPTIYHRPRFEIVGTRSLSSLRAAREPIGTTAKSLLIIRNRVKPWNQKYSAFVPTQISRTTSLVSRQKRDARDRHERAVRCGGR